MTLDEATEQYMARLLDEAPPLPSDLAALVIRTFTRTATDTSSPVSRAA
jgi:hypothetical protein